MLLIAEFDRRAGYEQWGCRTCSHWLSWQCGLDLRAAPANGYGSPGRSTLPVITDAFAAGTLSYSKVRALTRVATPANEAGLVMIAEHATAAQVEEGCAPTGVSCPKTTSSTRPTAGMRLDIYVMTGPTTAASKAGSR